MKNLFKIKPIRQIARIHGMRQLMCVLSDPMQLQFQSLGAKGQSRSTLAINIVSRKLLAISMAWLTVIGLFGAMRVLLSPTPAMDSGQLLELAVPYLLVALSPIAGFFIGRAAFRGKAARQTSSVHLSTIGKWRNLTPLQAVRHPSFGPIGFLASLVIGMMLNVVLRTGEYLLAIPALTTA
ncbi:MAG: hypothetical protein ABJQ14_00610, partial [Hyphomicrobiales bacterium]